MKLSDPSLTLQPVQKEDLEKIAELLFMTEKEPKYEWGFGTRRQQKEKLMVLLQKEQNRFSKENIVTLRKDGNLVGMLLTMEGNSLRRLTWNSSIEVIKQYSNVVMKVQFYCLTIGYSIFSLFKKECEKDEYYLSNIAIQPEYRGKGYADLLFSYGCDIAKQKGYQKVSLHANNDELVNYYKTLGFHLKDAKSRKMVKLI